MFKIDGTTKQISLTRGDAATIEIKAKNSDGTDYVFKVNDVVRFKVFKNKDCGCVVLQKDTKVMEEKNSINIDLTKEDTKIGEIISKPASYWYEVELNPDTNPQTIIGYDEDGAKVFMLYPEGGDN